MRGALRSGLLRAATSRPLSPLHRMLMKGSAAVFMFHRFSDPRTGVPGHPPEILDRFLTWLEEQDIQVWSLGDLVEALRRGRPLEGGVCFTVDDGYADFATVAMDVFAEHGCPVTVFLPTAFLDGGRWMWWDRIEWALSETEASSVRLPPPIEDASDDGEVLALSTSAQRADAYVRLVDRLKVLPRAKRRLAGSEIEEALGVELPAAPPPKYRPLTWDAVRSCEDRGATFGPHTENHVWLSAESDEVAEREIRGSWNRLKQELRHPLPVIGYPYGSPDSFGPRDMELARSCGLRAALSTVPAMIDSSRAESTGSSLYELPRFGFADDLLDARQVATGILRLRL